MPRAGGKPVLSTVGFLGAFVLLLCLPLVAFGTWFALQMRPRRRAEPGFKYVYVEDDGSVRELDTQERKYLTTEFRGADGARPYIKLRYESLTPDGHLRGYLRRRQVPKGIAINLPARES